MIFLLFTACLPALPDDDEEDTAASAAWDPDDVVTGEDDGEVGFGAGSVDVNVGGDEERFEYEVSEALGDGYLTIDITDVQGGTADVTLYVDDQYIGSEWADLEEADLHAWLSVEAGHRYLLVVESGRGSSYTLTVEHHAIADAFEPDDGWEEAHPLTSSASAYFHAGYATDRLESEEFDDWYRYESDGSDFSVRVSDMPDGLQGGIEIYDARDMSDSLVWEWSNEQGKEVVETASRIDPGTYYIRLRALSGEGHGTGALPEYLTSPYTVTVGEP